MAHTLAVGRKQFSHRRALVVRDTADAIEALERRDPKRIANQVQTKRAPSVVFMFPGGGAQYAGMGQELYATEPVYKSAIDECLAAVDPRLAPTLRGLMFPSAERQVEATEQLERPTLTLPALFATEYAMAKLLLSWNFVPTAMIGHSMGEYVAACLAGVMSVADGLAMVSLRGRLFDTLPPGAMLSVPLSESDARAALQPGLSIAAVNAAELCVISGPLPAIESLEKELTAKEVECTRIHISVAAHSEMLAPILGEFERFCRTIRLSSPSIPYVSNLTGNLDQG